MLMNWFAEGLCNRPEGSWNDFWNRWADDVNPHRTCHLLDAVKHQVTIEEEHIVPKGFAIRLTDTEFLESLIVRARPVGASQSPTWEQDVRQALNTRNISP